MEATMRELYAYSTSVEEVLQLPDANLSSPTSAEFTLGIEWEAEDARRTENAAVEAADEIISQFPDDYAMAKQDGSLGDGGFEIVTAPRTLPEHVQCWKGLVVPDTVVAWDTKRCGLHVHVDSRAFTALSLAKFLLFWGSLCPDDVDFLRAVCGRHPLRDGYAAEYCAVARVTRVWEMKNRYGRDRYTLINLTNLRREEAQRLRVLSVRSCKGNYSTVEVRAFRASTKMERLLGQVEMVHASVMFVREASIGALSARRFADFVRRRKKEYPHLSRLIESYRFQQET
jgi:hypothetical protein